MKAKWMYALVAALLLGSQTLSAQDAQQGKEHKEKKEHPTPEQIMQMRVDQMASVLMLDDATAAKFKPVYENYLNELKECSVMNPLKDVKADAPKAPQQPKELTDEEIAQILKDQFEQSRKILDIREKYYAEFSKILSQKQVMKIYQQERNNMDKMKMEYDRRKDGKPGHGQGENFHMRPQGGHPQGAPMPREEE